VAANLQRCAVWDKLRLLRLTENQRYAHWIGNVSYERALDGSIDLPPEVEVMYSQSARQAYAHVLLKGVRNPTKVGDDLGART
jgi:hypothetical protein